MQTLRVVSEVFSDLTIQPVKLEAREVINDLACYEVELKWDTQADQFLVEDSIDFLSWLGQKVVLSIELAQRPVQRSELLSEFLGNVSVPWTEVVGDESRCIHGVIQEARFLGSQGRFQVVAIQVSAQLHSARLNKNYRIYQNMNACDVLKKIVNPYQEVIHWRLQNYTAPEQYPVRDCFVQYNESDWDFFRRICSEWGINFWWEHDDESAYLVLSNCADGHTLPISQSYQIIPYFRDDQMVEEEHFYQFSLTSRVVPGSVLGRDYNYASPQEPIEYYKENTCPYPYTSNRVKSLRLSGFFFGAQPKHQVYLFPSAQVQPRSGNSFELNNWRAEERYRGQWNLERLQQRHYEAVAEGNLRGLSVGERFHLVGHPSEVANTDWVVREVRFTMVDVSHETHREQEQESGWKVQSHYILNPWELPMRPDFVPKPQASLNTATVVGKSGTNVHTDVMGRIKVQFHWDRYGSKNAESSCWVRVSQFWSGNQMGGLFIPRAQQEVLIDFINQDPDLPVCIGKVGNAHNLPNWKLTENKSLSGIATRELGGVEGDNHAGGRGNYLIFDDTKGHLQAQLSSDQTQSALSVGDIYRILPGEGRRDSRGQGFELRTDRFGAIRAGKGLLLTSYMRSGARGRIMDAMETQTLLEQCLQVTQQLSENARKRQAEPLTSPDAVKSLKSSIDGNDLKLQISSSIDQKIGALTDKLNINMAKYIDVHKGKLEKVAQAIAIGSLLAELAKVVMTKPVEPKFPEQLLDGVVTAEDMYLQSEYIYQKLRYEEDNSRYLMNFPGKAMDFMTQLHSLPKKEHNAFLSQPSLKTLLDQYVSPVQDRVQDIIELQKQNALKELDEVTDGATSLLGIDNDFSSNVVMVSGESGIGLVTPSTLQSYATESHNMGTAGDMNVSVGLSWLASVGKKISFFARQGLKLFSGDGPLEIHAQASTMDLRSKNAMTLMSTKDKIELIAEREILLSSGGGYIRIKNGDIEIHAPGKIDYKAESHPFSGPTRLNITIPDLPDALCTECAINARDFGIPFFGAKDDSK